jgi:hypothetical protein
MRADRRSTNTGEIVRRRQSRRNGASDKENSMGTVASTAKQAVYDKVDSQIKTIQAKLEALKAKAEAAKAIVEIKAIADLVTKKKALDQKLADLKSASESAYAQAKTGVESRVAELEQSVQKIEAKLTAA